MGCGRTSVEGEAEEITVLPMPKYRQRHGKRPNPFSTKGLDKFESVCAELSARREYIAKEAGVPAAMIRFAYSSKNGWIPVVLGARDQEIGRKKNGGHAAGVSVLVPAENNNDEKDGELRRKDEGNDINGESERRGFTVNAPTSPVRAHGDLTDCLTPASPKTVKPINIDPEHNHQYLHFKDKKFRRAVSMDNWRIIPEEGFDSLYRRTRLAKANDGCVTATVMIITLFCLVFYGRFFAILFTCVCFYLFPNFIEGSAGMRGMNRINDSRMVDLQSSEYTKGYQGRSKYSKHNHLMD